MKRIILILAIMTLPLLADAANQKKTSQNASQLVSVINQYTLNEGFHVVRLGSLATGMVKSVIRKAADKSDPDERAMLDLISGIKRVAIVEYEDCSTDIKNRFSSKVERLLSDENLLMSAKDSGETVKIYGFVSEDGGKMTDFILHAPSSGALICLFGSISIDTLSALTMD